MTIVEFTDDIYVSIAMGYKMKMLIDIPLGIDNTRSCYFIYNDVLYN